MEPFSIPWAPFAILAAPFVLLKLEGKKLRDFPKELSLDVKDKRYSVFRGIRLFFLTIFLVSVLTIFLGYFGLADSYKVEIVIQKQDPIVLLLAVSVFPVGEELLFRGYLQKRIGILFSSVLFAVLHYGYGSVAEILAALTVSVLFGLELKERNDVNSCILAHAGYNLFTLLLISV